MLEGAQIKLEDVSAEYKEFVDKFKPKKTTDDCYTPDNVYQAVLNWVVDEYGIDPDKVVRPFWPGGDYEWHEYPDGCVVVDNPPFSIITQICRMYQYNNIPFFLFAPYLTNLSINVKGITHILTDSNITYENGAVVNTAFVTNLEPGIVMRTAPGLSRVIKEANDKNRKEKRKELPKYSYPPQVVTGSILGYLSKYGEEYKVNVESCHFIRTLDSQKSAGKTIFGGGYLLSEKAAAEKAAKEKAAAEKAAKEKAAAEKAAKEKAAAEKWQLSERELQIIKELR